MSPPSILAADSQGMDLNTQWMVGILLLLLLGSSLVGRLISGQAEGTVNVPLVRTFRHRVRTWWMMMSILVASFFLGNIGAVVLFFFVSFWALREFITMTPTRGGDHRTLFWVFFAFTPLQYVLVGMNQYSLFSIVIPVYASLFIPARIAISGDKKRFLERSAKIQVGLLICVYALSYTPAILKLELTGNHDETVWGAEEVETENPEEFRTRVENGRQVYYENCVFCHGDNLSGNGMFVHGLDPLPTNFADGATIANLRETFLFWRIAKGGPGLPEEGAPWATAMPAWEQFLSEEEMWEVILFLYDFTGERPRATEEGEAE